MRITTNLQENFPFISVIVHVSHEYVGIIINQDAQVTSMYDYSMIKTDEEKQRFLELERSLVVGDKQANSYQHFLGQRNH